jgi:uncharacterized membrane protein SpoIIM required for sporulation
MAKGVVGFHFFLFLSIGIHALRNIVLMRIFAGIGSLFMQETDFIAQNKDKWSELEFELDLDNKDPEKLLGLFVETTDDLAYSQTHYPNRSVRHYLNGFARSIHARLYANRRSKKNAFVTFWQLDLPEAVYHARKQMTLSLSIMVFGLVIGIVSTLFQDDFPAIILSEHYVEKTEELIAQGNPLGVYGLDEDPLHMFLEIAWNNIQIAFGAFVMGALYGIGTVYLLLSTGIMVGAFTMFFVKKGLFSQMFFAVMLHGTLELGTIVIAGGAGLLLTRAIMFPGSFTRLESVVKASRLSMRIMIGVAVFLFYAALIEGYLTRYTDVSNVYRGALIFLSGIILVGYFIVYPIYLYKRGSIDPNATEVMPVATEQQISDDTIRKGNELVSDALTIFFRNCASLFGLSAVFAVIGTAVLAICNWGIIEPRFQDFANENLFQLDVWTVYRPLYVSDSYIYLIIAASVLSVAIFFSIRRIHIITQSKNKAPLIHVLLASITAGLLILTALQIAPPYRLFLLFAILPLALFIVVVSQRSGSHLFTALFHTFQLAGVQFGNFLTTLFIIALLHLLMMTLMSSSLVALLLYFVQINVPSTWFLAEQMPYYVLSFILIFIVLVAIQFTMILLNC